MHCTALLGKTFQHSIMLWYSITYFIYKQLHSYPAYIIQNAFENFGGKFFVYPKQHSDTLDFPLSLLRQELKWKLSLLSGSLQFLSQNSAVEVFRSIGEFTSLSIDMNISSEKSLTESSKMPLQLTQKTKSEEKPKCLRSKCYLVLSPKALNFWSLKLPPEAAPLKVDSTWCCVNYLLFNSVI